MDYFQKTKIKKSKLSKIVEKPKLADKKTVLQNSQKLLLNYQNRDDFSTTVNCKKYNIKDYRESKATDFHQKLENCL